MKIVFVVLCVFTLSASAAVLNFKNHLNEETVLEKLSAEGVSGQSTVVNANFSDYVDKTLTLIEHQAALAGPIALPHYNDSFVYKILYLLKTTVHTELTNGSIDGFSDIQRNGDSLVMYNSTDGIMTATVNLVFPNLVFYYDLAADWIFGASKAYVVGTVKNAVGTLELSVNKRYLNFTLEIWNFTTPQNVNIDIQHGGYTVNYLATAITASINNIFAKKIWPYIIDIVLKGEAEKFLDLLSKTLFHADNIQGIV